MKLIITALFFPLALSISGCQFVERKMEDSKYKTSELLNPAKIHQGTKTLNSDGLYARELPAQDYYNALNLARPDYKMDARSIVVRDPSLIVNYVDEGIGLVDTNCRRWFQNLDDMSRMLAFQNKQINIISQLGTTLLGVGGASSAWVTGYGAVNTMYAGTSENFNSAFLIAPTASKVKQHIEVVMKEESKALKTAAPGLTFKQAYTRLEHYADLCSHVRAKAIVDAALETTTTTLDKNQQPQTTPKVVQQVSAQEAAAAPAAEASTASTSAAAVEKK